MYKKNMLLHACLLSLAVMVQPSLVQAAPSFAGPSSVPQFHPLCIAQLKDWPSEGGALDLQRCAENKQDIEVLTTADGVLYAKRKSGGYFAYKPVGVLDKAMEILLTYDNVSKKSITAIYFIGRIPGQGMVRDYLTAVEEGGDRCLGGVSDARLISESILEVDINVTARQMMSFLEEEQSDDTKSISLTQKGYQAYACAGVVTKQYNLLDNQVEYTKVTFTRDESRKEVSRASRCYDNLVAQTLSPPRELNLQEYRVFLNQYQDQCGKNN